MQISYVIFLGLFSFFMLTDLEPYDPSIPGYHPSIAEYIIWGWVFTLWVEELRQVRPSSLYILIYHHRFSAQRQVHGVRFLHFLKSVRAIAVVATSRGVINAALTKQCCNPDTG